METQDLPITSVQAAILGGLEQKVAAAMRDREVALAMAVAGHGIERAEVVEIDTVNRVIRIKKEP